MNRRNALIGLGAIATGGGALFGSGAFSSVEADRTVTVQTAGDASGFLRMEVTTTYADEYATNDATSGELTFDLGSPTATGGGSGFNKNATTKISKLVVLENQGAENGITVGFGSGSASGTTTVTLDAAEVNMGIDDFAGNSPSTATLDTGQTAYIYVTVDSTVTGSGGTSGTVTLRAE